MRYVIDTENQKLILETNEGEQIFPLYSDEAFEILSHQWLRIGWNQKYPYTFTWLGRPIIQIPEDMFRMQEVIYRIKPDVILETGIAHGGSLMFSASLCKSMGRGRVIGVDVDIRSPNREAIESHELAPFITMIQGNSVDPTVVKKVKDLIKPKEKVLALFDSNHRKEHVFQELESYHDLIHSGSYLIVADGFMKDLYDVPRGKKEWQEDNPYYAIQEFLAHHTEFEEESPHWPFNESTLSHTITHWPKAWLKRK